MLFGPSIRRECPHCQEAITFQTPRSGNTFGGTHWSDTKSEYPMLPRDSEVQKCPRCGKYYFLSDAKILPSDESSRSLFDELFDNLA